jgi:hypothetical protein
MIKRIAALVAVLGFIFVTESSAGAASLHTYHHAYTIVYVENHASAFPVSWAVEYLRLTHPDVSVRYGACRTGAGCVKDYQMHRGRHTEPGMTYFAVYVGTTILAEPVITKYDLDYPWTTHDRYQAACHELLRGLGAEYSQHSLTTCMYVSLTGAASIHPNALDLRNLNEVYS